MALTLASAAAAQNVIVVDAAGGPGSDYTDVVAAMQGAQDGDLLLVRAGSYDSGALATGTSGKSRAIFADAGAAVVLRSSLGVENLSAAQWFSMRGIDVESKYLLPSVGFSLMLQHCDGAVRIQDCEFRPIDTTGFASAFALDCANIALAGIDVRAALDGAPALSTGIAGMGWTTSTGVIHMSTFRGNLATAHPSPIALQPINGSVGLVIMASRLHAAGNTINGGNGAPGFVIGSGPGCIAGGNGGSALQVGVDAVVSSTNDANLQPGAPGAGAGSCSAGQPGAPVGLAGGSYIPLSETARTLGTTSTVREGQALTATATGLAGELVVLLVSDKAGYLEFSGIACPLLLDSAAVPVVLGTIAGTPGQSAAKSQSATIQELGAGVEGALVRFQAAFIDATGKVHLSNESDSLLLDAGL
jgi:hypothetical protein